MTLRFNCLSACLTFTISSAGSCEDLPRPDDINSIDGIINAYYEVVSRQAGEAMQSARDKSLHLPASQVVMLTDDPHGTIKLNRMTIDDFH